MCDFEFLVNFVFFKDNFRVLTLCGEDFCEREETFVRERERRRLFVREKSGRRGIRECVPMFFDALEVMICARCFSIRGW